MREQLDSCRLDGSVRVGGYAEASGAGWHRVHQRARQVRYPAVRAPTPLARALRVEAGQDQEVHVRQRQRLRERQAEGRPRRRIGRQQIQRVPHRVGFGQHGLCPSAHDEVTPERPVAVPQQLGDEADAHDRGA